jgi:ATP-dependent DNA helicase RecQ
MRSWSRWCNYVDKTPGSGIVYVNTRSRAETIAGALRRAGVAAEAYHAGLAERGPVQDRFMANQTRVVVATDRVWHGHRQGRHPFHRAFPPLA